MNPLFLVTSAIHTDYGVYTAEQRYEQTLMTIDSIKARVPNSQIILLECSAKNSIKPAEHNELQTRIDGLLNFYEDQQVHEIYKSTKNHDIIKSMTELIVMGKTLDFILNQQPQLIKDIDWVFKLSGRYLLTDKFNPTIYDSPEMADKYVFSARKPSQYPPAITGHLREQLMSRLWGWPANKTKLVMYRFNLMLEDFVATVQSNKFRDVEHLLLKYFDSPHLHEEAFIGVSGELAPNGVKVED